MEQIIKDMIECNKINILTARNSYDEGYAKGYQDALVDLLDELKINHNYKLYND